MASFHRAYSPSLDKPPGNIHHAYSPNHGNLPGIDRVFEIKSLLAGAGSLCSSVHGTTFGDVGRLIEIANEKADSLVNELDALQAD